MTRDEMRLVKKQSISTEVESFATVLVVMHVLSRVALNSQMAGTSAYDIGLEADTIILLARAKNKQTCRQQAANGSISTFADGLASWC